MVAIWVAVGLFFVLDTLWKFSKDRQIDELKRQLREMRYGSAAEDDPARTMLEIERKLS